MSICRAAMVLPQPGPPASRVVRPAGRPPPVRISKPGMLEENFKIAVSLISIIAYRRTCDTGQVTETRVPAPFALSISKEAPLSSVSLFASGSPSPVPS